jgi:CRP-like cAMP-binding protein/di/tricarboxylate transporter
MDQFITTITRTSIFANLAREDLARVAGKVDQVPVAAATVIIRQGDAGDALYIVESGAVEVLHTDEQGTVQRIAILGPRECFGEIAIFAGTPRTATVVALVDTVLLRLTKEACDQLTTQYPAFSRHICRLLGERLVERGRELVRSRVGRDAVLGEFFAALPPPARTMLCRASVLDGITPELLTLVADGTADPTALAALAERSPRLVQAEDGDRWILHDDLREFLGAHLVREVGREAAAALHARAAAHFETAEDWGRAADHHRGAEAWDDLVRVLERHGDMLLERESPGRFLARLDAVPPGTRRARFHLVRLRAKAHVLHGDARSGLATCRELLGTAHAPSLDALAGAFRYHVQLAEVHRDAGDHAESVRSLKDGLAVLEPSADRRAATSIFRLPRAEPSRRRRWLSPRWLYAAAALAAGVAVSMLPAPAPMDAAGMRFLGMLTAAMILWSANVFDDFVIALALLSAWIIGGVARPEVALSGFTKASWFLFVGALGIGAAVTRSGLLYRAALAGLRRMRPSYPRYTAVLTVAGLIATPALPSMIGRMAVVAPVGWAIAESVGFAPRSAGAAGITLATFLGFGLAGFAFLTGSVAGLLGWNVLPEAARAEFGWTAWLVAAAPAVVVTLAGLWAAIHFLFPIPAAAALRVSRERFDAQLEILGPFTRREAFSLTVLGLAIAGWASAPFHGVNEAWIALAALVVFFLGGVLDRGIFRTNVDLGFLLFLGIVSGISGVAVAVKADQWLVATIAPLLDAAAVNASVYLFTVGFITTVSRLVLNKFAGTILLTLALVPPGEALGIHPGAVLLVILLTTDVWFLPFQLDSYQAAYFGTGEQGFSHAQGRRFMMAKLVVSVIAIAVSLPWWRALGLIR